MIKTLYPMFQHWSEGGSVWIFSDTHFDDVDVKLMDENWITSKTQIEILKQYCHKQDTLVLLGDIGNPAYLEELKCYKVLILGNHDQSVLKFENYFDEIYAGPLFISDKILLSHEPFPDLPFVFNIHGHDHSQWEKGINHLNVAANVINYKPVNLGEIIKKGCLSKIPTIHRWTIDNIK